MNCAVCQPVTQIPQDFSGSCPHFRRVVHGIFPISRRGVNIPGIPREQFQVARRPTVAAVSGMLKTILPLLSAAAIGTAYGQSRFEVLRAYNMVTQSLGSVTYHVPSNHVARLVDWRSLDTSPNLKGRMTTTYANGVPVGVSNVNAVVVGPCSILLVQPLAGGYQETTAVFEVFNNEATPPQRTAVCPAGQSVRVQLESSTDLAAWQPATNGFFPASELHRFFRVSLSPTNSP